MGTKQKILVVEDDLYIRDVYRDVLIEAGFDVTTAQDGEEGLVKIREGGYDLILLDVMMPKRNGLEVLKALQEEPPQKKNGSIVILTNLSQDPIIEDAKSHGAASYLVKSDLNPGQLRDKVRELLGQH